MMESSHYANHIMENTNTTQNKSTKKKLRFFSKSKKRESSNQLEYQSSNQCYCENCMRTVVNHNPNNYMIQSQQINPYYYPNDEQLVRAQSLSSREQYRNSGIANGVDEHTYMEVADQYVDRIYPPPQQFPCECHNCVKKRNGSELTTELLPLDTQIPLQMMGADSAVLCTIL